VTAVQCELTDHISEWQQQFLDYQEKQNKINTPVPV